MKISVSQQRQPHSAGTALATIAMICILGIILLCPRKAKAQAKVMVQNISVIGNKKTRKPVVLRELRFQEGDSLLISDIEKEIERSKQNVFNLRLFNTVEFNHQVIQGDLYVFITVSERWYFFPIPNVGLEERNSYDFFANPSLEKLVVGLTLDWKNVTGWNDRLQVYGQLGFSQRFYLDFIRPAFFKKSNIDLLLAFRFINEPQIIYGTDLARVKWGLTSNQALRRTYIGKIGLRKRFTARQHIFGQLSYSSYTFADSIYDFNPNYLTNPDSKEHYPSLVLTYTNDQRDYKSFPLQGFKLQLLFRQAGLGELATTEFTKIGFTWAHHIPIKGRWNFTYGTHNVWTLGRYVPWFEKNVLGIKRSEFPGTGYNLRGYERYAIDGSFVNMTKAELKFAIFHLQTVTIPEIRFKRFQSFPFGLYLSAFCDAGYVVDNTFNNEDNFLKSKALIGYGIGLNIIAFYDNLLRLEYARNHLNEGGLYFHASVSIK